MQFKCPLLPVVAACPCVLQQSANIPTNAIILFYLLTNPCTSPRSDCRPNRLILYNQRTTRQHVTGYLLVPQSHLTVPWLVLQPLPTPPSFRQSIYPTSISQECSQSPLVVRLSFCSTESQHHLLYISNVTGTLCQFQFIVPSPEWLAGWRHPP